MGLTSPYKQHTYLGDYANESACLVFIQSNKWDSSSDGLGTPQNGMLFYDTTAEVLKCYLGGAWFPLGKIDTHYIEDDSESSTTSITYQQKLRLTFTPLLAGDYEVIFSALVSHSNTGNLMLMRIQIDDTTTEREISADLSGLKYVDGAWHPYAGNFVVTLSAASHNIDLDYASGEAGKTMYIQNVVLVARRID